MNVQPRVSRISIGRLKNLGNYEHIRYEVTVEIPEGVDATATLKTVETALNLMAKPAPDAWRLKHAKDALAKPRGEWTSIDTDNEASNREIVARAQAWQDGQDYARALLGDFSLSRQFTDHKASWDDDQY